MLNSMNTRAQIRATRLRDEISDKIEIFLRVRFFFHPKVTQKSSIFELSCDILVIQV